MNKYVYGFQLMIIGMGTVFISLYLLSAFMYLLGKLFGDKKVPKKNDKEKNSSADTGKIDEVETDDEESNISRKRKIAAATAAVYQLLDENKRYRIISIKKANSSWKR